MSRRFVVDLRRAHPTAVTGKERYAEGLFHGLCALGCAPVAALKAPMGLREEFQQELHGEWSAVQLPASWLGYHRGLRQLARAQAPTVLISPLSFMPAVYAPPAVTIVHDDAAWQGAAPSFRVTLLERVFRPLALRKGVACANSEHTRETLDAGDGARTTVLPPPLLPRWHEDAVSSFEARSGILMVSTLNPHKRIDHAIRALTSLREEHRLTVVGADGGEGPRLRALADELGVSDRVVFTGPLTDDEVRAHYDSALLLLSTSDYEGLSFPILEAGTRGLPVVSTPVGIAPEVLDPAYLVQDPGSAELVRCIEALVDDREAWRAASEFGRSRTAGMSSVKAAEALLGALEP